MLVSDCLLYETEDLNGKKKTKHVRSIFGELVMSGIISLNSLEKLSPSERRQYFNDIHKNCYRRRVNYNRISLTKRGLASEVTPKS